MTTAPPLHLDVVRQPDALRALARDWRELAGRVPEHGISQDYDWAWRGWEHTGQSLGRELCVVTGRSEGRLVLVWPLATFRQKLWRMARWLGSETSDYSDVLVERGPHTAAWLESAWDCFRQESGADAVYFDHVREDAAIAPLVAAQHGARRHFVPAPFLDLSEWSSWDEYMATRRARFRRELRRFRRRLEDLGPLRFELAETPECVEQTLDWLLRHKSQAFEAREESAPWLSSPRYRGFIVAVARDCLKDGRLVLTRLLVGDRLAAASAAFAQGGRLEGLLAAFDPELRTRGPGRIQLEEQLAWCCAQGIPVVDFRVGAEPYKYEWTGSEVQVGSHLVALTGWGRRYLSLRESGLASRLREVRDTLSPSGRSAARAAG